MEGATLIEAMESIRHVHQPSDNDFRFTCDYVHRVGTEFVVSGMLHSGSLSNHEGFVYVTPHATQPIPIKTIEHLGKQIYGSTQPGQFISVNLQCSPDTVPRRSILLKSAQAISLPTTFTGTFVFLGAPGFKELVSSYCPSFHFNINNSPSRLIKLHSILKKGKVVKEEPTASEIVPGTAFSATFELLKPTHMETFSKSRMFGSCVVYDNFYVTIVGIVTELGTKQFALSKAFLDKVKVAPPQVLSSGRLTKGAGRP